MARPGVLAEPGVAEKWGGRKAIEYVYKTLATFGEICALCGMPGANSADHIIPISKGGAVYVLENLQPAHRRCNYGRQAKPMSEYELVHNGTAWFGKES